MIFSQTTVKENHQFFYLKFKDLQTDLPVHDVPLRATFSVQPFL